jgi:hypothetical protein
MLQQLVRKLDIGAHVIFQNRFVELKELCEFLGIADIYTTPYLEEAQITSGTLAYAMGTGKAIISTPYWYATEMLAEGRGRIVPFTIRMPWRNRSSTFWTTMSSGTPCAKKPIHSPVTRSGRKSPGNTSRFSVKCGKTAPGTPVPRHSYVENIKAITNFELPEIKLDHLKAFTDDTGILQHANYTIPDRTHGYCTDDNARALLVAAMGQKYLPTNGWGLDSLSGHYLGFLLYAFNEKNGRFRNFMTYSRQWMEEIGSEDAHGRAIWSLGKRWLFLKIPGIWP